MSRNNAYHVASSEITPESIYLNRRNFLKGMSLLGSSLILAACARTSESQGVISRRDIPPTVTVDELGDLLTSFESIANYNNYFEFGFDKQSPAERAGKLQTNSVDSRDFWPGSKTKNTGN